MLRKFELFFITFGLSFLVSHWGWTDQGTAFILIYIVASALIIAFIILIWLFAGDEIDEKLGDSMVIEMIYAIDLCNCLIATWGATKLFPVDFAVAFQIMSFGQCLCGNTLKKDD